MLNHSKVNLISALLMSISLSACAIGSDYQKPETALPEQWPWTATSDGQAYDVVSKTWWHEFRDPALNALIEEGLEANADLLVAAARVSQARAMLTGRQADLYPSLDAQAGASRVKNSAESAAGAASSKPFNDLSLGAVLNYELDIWGRIRRSTEAARAQLLASQAARDAIRLSVISNIAQGYFNLRTLDAQLEITENTIASREDALEFQKKRYDVGGENSLTYHQAEAELAAAQAQKPALEQARAEQESALAVLLGRSPRAIVDGKIGVGKALDDVTITPFLPRELPSTLLERRPDIASAEQSLIAANADIAVAKADYFPRVSLSGLLGLGAMDADDLLRSSARKWQAGATLAMPIVDFGRTSSRVDSAEAARDEALANYGQNIRVAFKEVMDALSSEKTSAAREDAQQKQLSSREETLRLSDLRYKSGYSDYLEVLDAQRYLYQAQMDRVTARRDRLIAMVNLYRALGGGWNSDVPSVAQRATTAHMAALEDAQMDNAGFENAQTTSQEVVQETIAQEPLVYQTEELHQGIAPVEAEAVTQQAVAEEAAAEVMAQDVMQQNVVPSQPEMLAPVEEPALPQIPSAPAQQPMQLPSEMM